MYFLNLGGIGSCIGSLQDIGKGILQDLVQDSVQDPLGSYRIL